MSLDAGDDQIMHQIGEVADRVRLSLRTMRHYRGLDQVEQEGVLEVLGGPDGDADGHPTHTLVAVDQMPFEVFAHRLQHEFNAAVELSAIPCNVAGGTDAATAGKLRSSNGARLLARSDNSLLALFETPYRLQRLEAGHPDWCLDHIATAEPAAS